MSIASDKELQLLRRIEKLKKAYYLNLPYAQNWHDLRGTDESRKAMEQARTFMKEIDSETFETHKKS